MSWVVIIIIGIIVFNAFRGYQKGLIITLFNLASFALTIFLAVQLYPVASKIITENTKIDDTIKASVNKTLLAKEKKEASENKTLQEQRAFINGLPLPKSFKEKLEVNNNPKIYDLLGVTDLNEYISAYVAQIIINALSLIILFVFLFIALRIVVMVLNIFSKLPVINSFNKGAGLLFGLGIGVIEVWGVFVILTLFSSNPSVVKIFEEINNTKVLSYLYNHNVLVESLLKLPL